MVTVRVRRGKHALDQGRTRPTHELKNFKELLTILRKDFNVRA